MRQSPLSDVDQTRVAAAIISRQWQQAAVRQSVERAVRKYGPAAQRSLEAEKQRQRKPAPRVASHPSIIGRRAPDLRQMQADLSRSGRELERLRRQVARERAGAR